MLLLFDFMRMERFQCASAVLFLSLCTSVVLSQEPLTAIPATKDYDKSEKMDLPDWTDIMGNVWDPISQHDVPFFWYIPKAGGLTFHTICIKCLDLNVASVKGDPTGDVITIQESPIDGGSYFNVDPSTVEGINRARTLQLSANENLEVYFSHHLAYSARLFSTAHKGRLFTMIRHPVQRQIELFYYMQSATWEDDYDVDLAAMSLEEYSMSEKMVENFMVRSLLEMPDSFEVKKVHVDTAKEILRRKFIVGILDWFDVSVYRFEKFFGWWESKEVWSDRLKSYCHFQTIEDGDHTGSTPHFTSTDKAFVQLSVRNWADIELYMYAKHLFVEQEKLVK